MPSRICPSKRTTPMRSARIGDSDRGPVDPATDDGLRALLARRGAENRSAGSPEWEAVGAHLLALAKRDAWRTQHHAPEFIGAYLFAALELLRRRPHDVIAADSPWGLVVTKARLAGQHAAGAEASGGLTDRDPVTHHVRIANVPLVVSLDNILERQFAAAE